MERGGAAAAGGGRELRLPLSDASDEDAKRSSGSAGGGMSLTPLSSGPRKPRGRPPGSKNKPKPPVVITRESEAAMHPAVLEVPAGCDILDSLAAFSRRRRLGVSLLSGSGAVHNLSLRHPTALSSTISFPGRFEILSMSGTLLPPEVARARGAAGPVTVSVAGGLQGQVIGGAVAGALTAAEAVVLVVATFSSPEFYRLPLDAEGEEHRRGKEEEEEEEEEEDVKPEVSGGAGGYVAASADMVLWGTPRAPPPHSHRPPPHHHY